eukprot:4106141-Pyramimonas_sp.AAC.1
MQNLDVHLDVETGNFSTRKFQYIRDAAVGAKKHISSLQKFYSFAEKDTLVISVYQLFSLGTTKKLAVDQMRSTLDSVPGIAFVIYPRLPKNARRAAKRGASVEAEPDPDLDDEFNDVDGDGELPELLSQENMATTNTELTAQ